MYINPGRLPLDGRSGYKKTHVYVLILTTATSSGIVCSVDSGMLFVQRGTMHKYIRVPL